jgi:hypothetical protein
VIISGTRVSSVIVITVAESGITWVYWDVVSCLITDVTFIMFANIGVQYSEE